MLFDVDGTLTMPRLKIEQPMVNLLKSLKKIDNISIGTIGGSNLPKQEEQLKHKDIGSLQNFFDYVFAENGLIAYKGDIKLGDDSIRAKYDQKTLQSFINFVLRYVADLEIPVKTGTFVEFLEE